MRNRPSLPRHTTSLLLLIGTLCSLEPIGAQQLVFHYADPGPFRFGFSVAVLDDFDGDCTPEIGIGSWGDGPYVISGQTGAVLYHSTTSGNVEAYGASVDGLPDITGDGIAEYMVGSREVSGSTPLHEIRSGADGSLVRSHAFSGFEITAHQDLDGDGWADYALVDERVMQIRSGISGVVLGQWAIPPGQGDRLNRVARTGDVNGDQVPDVVGGQWDWTGGGGMGPGRVHMFSGADGALLWTSLGTNVPDFFGTDVTGDIDVNLDGIPDVVAITSPRGHAVDYVRILSGQDGSLLREELLPPLLRTTCAWRYSVVTLQDMDGDGVAEYAIGGADGSCAGVVELRSGATGTSIVEITGSSGFGSSLDGSEDWDGDGLVDLAVGAVDCDQSGGEVFIYSLVDLFDCNGNGVPDWQDIASGTSRDCNLNGVPDECEGTGNYCTAKVSSQGCTPVIDYTGCPTLSGPDDFEVTAGNVLNNKYGIMIWSHGPNNLPFMGGVLCVAPPITRTPVQDSGGNAPPLDCSGAYSFHFSQAYMASKLIPAGTQLYAQYWSRDPGFAPPDNVGLTNGLGFVVQP